MNSICLHKKQRKKISFTEYLFYQVLLLDYMIYHIILYGIFNNNKKHFIKDIEKYRIYYCNMSMEYFYFMKCFVINLASIYTLLCKTIISQNTNRQIKISFK